MAEPVFATVAAEMAYAVDPLNHLEIAVANGTTGYAKLSEDLVKAIDGTFAAKLLGPADRQRAGLSSLLGPGAVRARIVPLLRQMAPAIDYPRAGASPAILWRKLHEYMVANSDTINSPEHTYDTTWSAGGGNVGDGEAIRLTVDSNGQALEGFTPDTYTLTCETDSRRDGKKHQETFTLRGTDAAVDYLTEGGSGLEVTGLRSLAASDSKALGITNPSWNTFTGDPTLTALPGWTQNTGGSLSTNLAINTSIAYRSTPGETDSNGLTFSGDELIYQLLSSSRFKYDTPYLFDVACHRVSTATGTVTIRVSDTLGSGGVSATLSLASLTADTWGRLRITVGANCWPASWALSDLYIQISVASLSGTFVVDDLVVAPFTRVGHRGDPNSGLGAMGQYVAILGGAEPWVKDDTLSVTDSAGGTRAVLYHWLTQVAGLGYLPSTSGGTETIADR